MPRDEEEIPKLKGRIRELEEQNDGLKKENEELKKRRDRARGVPAEDLVAQMTGGKRTGGYKDLYDVRTQSGSRIEVKLSKVHDSKSSRTKRWTWANVLGPKQYDFLVLAGEKDPRCKGYPSDLAYVFFLVPRSKVDDIKGKGNSVALNTNFQTAGAGKAKILIERYLVRSQEEFTNL
jgi:hypothetical protein